jgi:hypothetical protein
VIKPIGAKVGFPKIHWRALRYRNNPAMLNAGVDGGTKGYL